MNDLPLQTWKQMKNGPLKDMRMLVDQSGYKLIDKRLSERIVKAGVNEGISDKADMFILRILKEDSFLMDVDIFVNIVYEIIHNSFISYYYHCWRPNSRNNGETK